MMWMKIKLGLTNLPVYGPHPGIIYAITFPILGFLAGLDEGIVGGLIGLGIMSLFIIPLFLIGAHDRGSAYLKRLQRDQ